MIPLLAAHGSPVSGLNPPHLITINIDITNLSTERERDIYIFFINSDSTQFYHIITVTVIYDTIELVLLNLKLENLAFFSSRNT